MSADFRGSLSHFSVKVPPPDDNQYSPRNSFMKGQKRTLRACRSCPFAHSKSNDNYPHRELNIHCWNRVAVGHGSATAMQGIRK